MAESATGLYNFIMCTEPVPEGTQTADGFTGRYLAEEEKAPKKEEDGTNGRPFCSRRKRCLLFDLAGAVRAAGSVDVDLAEAVGALLGGGSGRLLLGRLFGGGSRLVHRLDDAEQYNRHQQEVDHGGNEVAVGDRCFSDGNGQMGEIKPAGDHAEKRHDNVIDEGIDDALESTADDHADGQIHHVALADEFFELRDKLFHSLCFLSF